jgi:hypothetical protein
MYGELGINQFAQAAGNTIVIVNLPGKMISFGTFMLCGI